MKYRISTYQDLDGCYASDCTVYVIQKSIRFLGIHLYWSNQYLFFAEKKDEAYRKLNELNNK